MNKRFKKDLIIGIINGVSFAVILLLGLLVFKFADVWVYVVAIAFDCIMTPILQHSIKG